MHVADHAEHDDPQQRQLSVEDVEAGEQHRRLGPRKPDHTGGNRQQRDAGEAEVPDDVRRQIDERAGDGCREQHGGKRSGLKPVDTPG